tara:strand:- start:151 stop:450 length:300 start_codon:yes stop_codon:yes gene_type:complete
MSGDSVQNLTDLAKGERAEIELLAESLDESTSLSWLWALLFGPIYYWVHGFVGRGFLILALNFIIIGFFIAPFLAYPAWKKRALEKAEKMAAVNKLARK